ncbi:bifunctional adenosylcobinamide kinase/adenosylcobinamide-phosphate guanylyltransferase [Marinomonas sp. 15G1-11]|uniref:Bifunctional adenosylcobalamin biosynthesis protein n=1 Tax=Marinomonas phaeophyticola TaxID=3004091 RepID=A0ABT4JRY3_9GAMM|nr:bifunctional adenosylcobinamide kinase/adenosylcobinamide-phosphate guanylyltransferase [Marinomonas sp. 15G1-11]MCZ2721005.1 bifunctional adenosylcobinamide kinase/adenosylcobinamide-phosphate guanylyltransferase [Marinomonas sp. 15G1-11]
MKHLVLGGVRSGKSHFSESWINTQLQEQKVDKITYIATSQAWDEEMRARIHSHQLSRPSSWDLIEEPILLAEALKKVDDQGSGVIIECLTLWLTNLLCLEDEGRFAFEKSQFLSTLESFQGKIVIVSGEVGLGIMPMNALARRFADELGMLNQILAQLCPQVTLVSAGLPLVLKNESDGSQKRNFD